jgi:hypothetical protein
MKVTLQPSAAPWEGAFVRNSSGFASPPTRAGCGRPTARLPVVAPMRSDALHLGVGCGEGPGGTSTSSASNAERAVPSTNAARTYRSAMLDSTW